MIKKYTNFINFHRLPEVADKIARQHATIDRRLSQLPKATQGEIQPKVLRTLQELSIKIQRAMDPESDHFKEWRNLREQFREAVVLLRPRVSLKDYTDDVPIPVQEPNFKDGRKRVAHEVVNLVDNEDGESVASENLTPRVRIKRQRSPEVTPSGSVKKLALSTGHEITPIPLRLRVIPERSPEINYFVDYRRTYKQHLINQKNDSTN